MGLFSDDKTAINPVVYIHSTKLLIETTHSKKDMAILFCFGFF